MDALKKEKSDNFTQKNLMAALQKLTIRFRIQSLMINEGAPELLIDLLENHENISDYTLEYAAVCFMNFTIKKDQRKSFMSDYKRVVKVITNVLLGNSNIEVI